MVGRSQQLKILLAVFLACAIFSTTIVSLNLSHIECCEEEHCVFCFTIHFSQEIVMMIALVISVLTTIHFLLYVYLAELYQKQPSNQVVMVRSLASQKIQFNN